MTTPYIDPNLIFAKNAPAQDKPAAFQNYDKGWDESRKNDGRPLIPQMNYLTQQADLKNLYIHENGAALPYKEGVAYEENAVVVKDGVLQQWKGGVWAKPSQSDSAITTWSGRTQEDKNKELASLEDFNIAGDGITDDTQAFIDFENIKTGAIVDLKGKTYKVDMDFTDNTYINGVLKVSESVAYVKGAFHGRNLPYKLDGGNGFEVGWLRAKHPTDTFANSSRTIIQGIAFDVKNNFIYAQTTFSGTAGVDETSRILKYAFGTYPNLTDPIKSYDAGTVVGHQNIGLTYENGEPVFWSTTGTGISNRALHVAQFKLDEAASSIKDVKYFKLWSESKHVLDASRCLAVSPDGGILVSTNALQSDGTWMVRVFKTSIFNAAGDYSNQFLYEFPFTKQGRSVQSVATDGEYIYIHHGGSETVDGVVEIRTIEGALVALDPFFKMGKDTVAQRVANSQSTAFYEDEVLTLYPHNGRWLFASVVATGRTDNWQNNSILVFEDIRPKLVGSDVVEISATNLRFRRRLPSGGLSDNFSIDVPVIRVERSFSTPYTRYVATSQNNATPPSSSIQIAQIQAAIPTSETNTDDVIKGHIQGWYNTNKSFSWNISAFNAAGNVGAAIALNGGSGRVNVTGKFGISDTPLYADNAAAKAGGLINGDVYRTSTGQLMVVY